MCLSYTSQEINLTLGKVRGHNSLLMNWMLGHQTALPWLPMWGPPGRADEQNMGFFWLLRMKGNKHHCGKLVCTVWEAHTSILVYLFNPESDSVANLMILISASWELVMSLSSSPLGKQPGGCRAPPHSSSAICHCSFRHLAIIRGFKYRKKWHAS